MRIEQFVSGHWWLVSRLSSSVMTFGTEIDAARVLHCTGSAPLVHSSAELENDRWLAL